jgi:hypothetical protein
MPTVRATATEEGTESEVEPIARWLRFIDSLSWKKGNLDQSSYDAFLRAGSLGLYPDIAAQEVSSRIEAAGDIVRLSKLKNQIRRAYAFAGTQATEIGDYKSRSRRPQYVPHKLKSIARQIDFLITPEWLEARSPVSAWNRTPAGILHQLYRPGELILIFNHYKSQGQSFYQHGGQDEDFSCLDQYRLGSYGVWFLVNPVDGEYHYNPRELKESRRSEESITSFRYAVLESDEAPKELWLKALVQLPLPIASITDSGGKSIHALIRIDAGSKTEWDELVRETLAPLVVPIGADLGALTAVRLTRLGNCHRGQTDQWQKLLFLDPEPNLTPLIEKPLTSKGHHSSATEP